MDNEMCDLQYYNGDEKMSEFVRKNICEGVAFSSVTDDRFKIGRQSATLIVPLSSETAAANALLSCVLSRSCREYPDFTETMKQKIRKKYLKDTMPDMDTNFYVKPYNK